MRILFAVILFAFAIAAPVHAQDCATIAVASDRSACYRALANESATQAVRDEKQRQQQSLVATQVAWAGTATAQAVRDEEQRQQQAQVATQVALGATATAQAIPTRTSTPTPTPTEGVRAANQTTNGFRIPTELLCAFGIVLICVSIGMLMRMASKWINQ